MKINPKHTITIFFLIMSFSLFAQNEIEQIKYDLESGNVLNAKTKISEINFTSYSPESQIELNKIKGDIHKTEGDIEAALLSWEISNQLRRKLYNKDDFHLAWNYALLSNYHYEKINTELAILYADSCAALIKNLSIPQQLEIEIYKIWNILGQSYKQKSKGLSSQEIKDNYLFARSYYVNSLKFIKFHNISQYQLNLTYRLIGNSHLDLIFYSNNEEFLYHYKKATLNYEKSKVGLQKLYGKQHFQLANTLFVQGLLNYYAEEVGFLKLNKKAIDYFEKSLSAYSSDINKIPNKESFLMTCSYLTKAYLKEFNKTKDEDLLNKAKTVNIIAVENWEKINSSFGGNKINQNLAIYSLIPFEETISIELLKMKNNLNFSINEIFEANQKLKYYDLLINSSHQNKTYKSISIGELQNKLKSNELFLDFHTSITADKLMIVKIDKQTAELILVNVIQDSTVSKFNNALINFDFETYTELGQEIYSQLIEPCNVKEKELILCPSGAINNIPFDALLCSGKNKKKNDYRKLDYLLLNNKIQFVLNPQLFRADSTEKQIFKISAFAPFNANYSELPFSSKLVNHIGKNYESEVFEKESANKKQFLNSTNPILHLSGHGTINTHNPLLSGLVFSDSLLKLKDVLNLQNPPNLVVLNTCNSSLGKIYRGDGINGFVRAFHAYGVSTTLSNNWEVDDKASNDLLSRFYSYLNSGHSTSDALLISKQAVIKGASNSNMAAPYYWAGHKLIGEELEFEDSSRYGWIWVIGLVIFVFGLLFASLDK